MRGARRAYACGSGGGGGFNMVTARLHARTQIGWHLDVKYTLHVKDVRHVRAVPPRWIGAHSGRTDGTGRDGTGRPVITSVRAKLIINARVRVRVRDQSVQACEIYGSRERLRQ